MSDTKRKKVVVEERKDDCRELVHVHLYQTITLADGGHNHNMLGISAPARVTNGTHVHRLRGRTSFVDGHWHAYDVYTGPAVQMPDGTHMHYYTGTTSEVERHVHNFSGATNVAVDRLLMNNGMVFPREEDEEGSLSSPENEK